MHSLHSPKLTPTILVLAICAAATAAPIPFKHVIVDDKGPNNPWAKIAADINSDGLVDIIIGGQKGPLVWYAAPNWKKTLICEGGYNTVDGEAGDIDGDGDLDIVMGGLFWYENPLKGGDPSAGPWKAHKIADHPTHDVELGDLNRDGRLDIVTRNQSEFGEKAGNKIFLWRQDPGDKWSHKVIDCDHGEGLELADLDRDGDLDIITGGAWFENDGRILAGAWKRHDFCKWHPNASVQVADFNADNRPDIVLAPSELKGSYYRISWFEAPSDPTSPDWKEHVIENHTECVIHGLVAADIDGDGIPDVVSSEMHQGVDPDEVVVRINQSRGASWTRQVISDKGSHYIQAADLDGDGDLDLLGANWSGPYQPVEIWLNHSPAPTRAQAPGFDIQLDTIRSGFDKKTCWVHARAGAIPGPTPKVVMTMQKLLLTGSDVFYALNEMRTDDMGKTWTGPVEHTDTLGRRDEPDGVVVAVCDWTPKWHAATGKLLGTGQTVRYKNNRVMKVRDRETGYAVYDPGSRTWTPWKTLEMPDRPDFKNCGAGSVQRYDLEDGTILLPVYFKKPKATAFSVTVLKCSFDGRTLRYLEHGSEYSVPIERGLCEPSLTRYHGRFYLTIRNDKAGYVTSGADGLHFAKPKKWCFDDGSDLGNYNTQQHWVTHSDGLFLVYTRRGANNDHVFRNRAPLFIAQVDPEKLRVIRSTERILVPERGARLGNFGVVDVTPNETWITVTEWMQTTGPDPHDYRIPMKYGSNNAVFAARIKWKTPNQLVRNTP